MCVFLVCVLGSFRASVCAFRVSELLVVRLSFVVKLFRLRCVSCEIPKFSCRVSNSISRILEVVFWSRILNSTFSFRCSIRFLEFQFSIRNSNSSSLNFRVEFVVEIFVSLRLSTSRISLLYSTSRISSFRFEFSIQVSWFLEFEFVVEFRIRLSRRLDLFDFSNFAALFDFSKPHSSFEFLIELFNFRRNLIIINAIVNWRPQLFSHSSSRFALVATRALRALFVRKILVKRQFTCSLYFGIIEL